MTIDQAMALAEEHHRAGRLAEAERIYLQLMRQKPDDARVLRNLGLIAIAAGRWDAAIEVLSGAIRLMPNWAEPFNQLGLALYMTGRYQEAIASCRRAVEIDDRFGMAWFTLGNSLTCLNKLEEGIAALQKSLEISPLPAVHNSLGVALSKIGRHEEAVTAFHHALAMKPDLQGVHTNLGFSLSALGRFDDAIAAGAKAAELQPRHALIRNNLGNYLRDAHRFEEAIESYRIAVELDPLKAQLHFCLALTLLATNRFAEGWDEFEWRLKCADRGLKRIFNVPQWDGEDLTGKTLLVHGEAGYGDSLQFVRYVPMLEKFGGEVILECQGPLLPLFRGMAGTLRVMARGEELPKFDYEIPLPSLPRIFKTDLTNIPATVPYLNAPVEHREKWKSRLGEGGKRVGLIWGGASSAKAMSEPHARAVKLLRALKDVPGYQFVGLQLGDEATTARETGLEITEFAGELYDFADTAAVVENLDLVISVDTSVAHLAGALGRPTWVMIPWNADFRWLIDREDSPWYPTMRLFREDKLDDWTGVVDRIATALRSGIS